MSGRRSGGTTAPLTCRSVSTSRSTQKGRLDAGRSSHYGRSPSGGASSRRSWPVGSESATTTHPLARKTTTSTSRFPVPITVRTERTRTPVPTPDALRTSRTDTVHVTPTSCPRTPVPPLVPRLPSLPPGRPFPPTWTLRLSPPRGPGGSVRASLGGYPVNVVVCGSRFRRSLGAPRGIVGGTLLFPCRDRSTLRDPTTCQEFAEITRGRPRVCTCGVRQSRDTVYGKTSLRPESENRFPGTYSVNCVGGGAVASGSPVPSSTLYATSDARTGPRTRPSSSGREPQTCDGTRGAGPPRPVGLTLRTGLGTGVVAHTPAPWTGGAVGVQVVQGAPDPVTRWTSPLSRDEYGPGATDDPGRLYVPTFGTGRSAYPKGPMEEGDDSGPKGVHHHPGTGPGVECGKGGTVSDFPRPTTDGLGGDEGRGGGDQVPRSRGPPGCRAQVECVEDWATTLVSGYPHPVRSTLETPTSSTVCGTPTRDPLQTCRGRDVVTLVLRPRCTVGTVSTVPGGWTFLRRRGVHIPPARVVHGLEPRPLQPVREVQTRSFHILEEMAKVKPTLLCLFNVLLQSDSVASRCVTVFHETILVTLSWHEG